MFVYQSLGAAAHVSKVSSTFDDDELPWPSKVSIAAFIVYGLMVLISMWWYGCKRAYAQGSRIGLPRGCRDGRVMQPTTMLVCGSIGIALKVVALGVDWWTTFSQSTSSSTYSTRFGSFAFSGSDSTRKYTDVDDSRMRIISATSAFTFAAVLLSILVSLYVQLTLWQIRVGAAAVALHAEKLYRGSGIVSVLTSTGWSMWILGQWIFLFWLSTEYTSSSSAYSVWAWPSVSAFCTLAAMIFDSVIHSSGKATLLNTPPYGAVALGQPLIAAQQQMACAVPVGQQYQAYAPTPVSYGVPQQQQQHLPQQQYQQQPQGYVQPAAYELQHGRYVQQPQQAYASPPVYAPQANFAGQPQRVAPESTQAYPQL